MKCQKHKAPFVTHPTYRQYGVCPSGCVFSLRVARELRPYLTAKGYHRYAFSIGSKQKHILAHRLVADIYLSKPKNESLMIDHMDGNKVNNSFTNLRWVTNAQNVRYGYDMRKDMGLANKTRNPGSKNGQAKLTENQVSNILHMRGSASARELAKVYGYSTTTYIYDIWKRKSWRHIA